VEKTERQNHLENSGADGDLKNKIRG